MPAGKRPSRARSPPKPFHCALARRLSGPGGQGVEASDAPARSPARPPRQLEAAGTGSGSRGGAGRYFADLPDATSAAETPGALGGDSVGVAGPFEPFRPGGETSSLVDWCVCPPLLVRRAPCRAPQRSDSLSPTG